MRQIFVVAGEPSADLIGARFMRAMKAREQVRFTGVGGPLMSAEGLEPIFPMTDLSVMGFVEILPHIPRLLRRMRQTVKAVRRLKPDIVVTIDAPDFNFRVLRRLKGDGIPLVHYVAPTVWAYRPGRAAKIARFLDHLLVLFSFEPPYFDAVGLGSTFVGHPLVEEGIERADGPAFRARHGIAADATVLMVLPGSRRGELTRHLPVYAETLHRLHQRSPNLVVVVPTVEAQKNAVADAAQHWPQRVIIVEGNTEKYAAMAASDAALAASGTVTLELAIAAVPMVVCYKANPLTMAIARRIVRVPHIALANIVAGEAVAPEFIQERCSAALLSDALGELLGDEAARALQTRRYRETAKKVGLGDTLPSERAAQAVLDILDRADGTT